MMNTDELRRGFGSSAGRVSQVSAYHKALNEAADEIDRLRAELKTWHDFGRGLAHNGMNGLTVPVEANPTKADA